MIFDGQKDVEKLRGHVRIEVRNAKGEVVRVYEKDNLIVDAGKNLLRDFLKGDSVQGLSRLALGTGTTQASASDTALENETYRQAFSDIAVENGLLRLTTFISSSATSGDFTEFGLFGNGADDTSGSGTLFSRVVYSTPVSKSSAESLTVQWDITL